MVHTNNNTSYYINPAYLSFEENSGYGANLIQVSASSSCRIRVFIPGEIGYDADGNYRSWKITAYNNRFPDNDAFYIYVRLERNGTAALVVYSKSLYNTNGSSVDGTVDGSPDYYYIRIGEVSATDGTSIREISYDTGRLESDQVKNEGTELNEMWELDKYSTPWLVRAKQWLSSFTVKGFITLIGGLVFRSGDTEKAVTDIKRSTDSDEDVPVSDNSLPTTKYTHGYVESELEKLDDRFLSKIHPDETEFHIGLKGGLTTTEAVSTDYAKDTVKGGWAIKKNGEEEWYAEADHIIARILANVYDLLVRNNAVFKGDLSSEEFISGFVGGKGWAIRMKEWLNAAGVTEQRSVAEFDDLIVRGTMRVYEFVVSQLLGENDNRIFTGMMEVDHYDAAEGKVYLNTNGGKLYNPFRADDIIIVQQYGGIPSEGNGHYVTKQYELVITEAGVGNIADGEDRLDWVTFRSFTTSMEGGDESLIMRGDTFVRIDNLSDPARKGTVQIMSVGEDTPYMDMVYGAKTDPENALKGRLGNIGGVYNPLFGWLKEFGAYLINLYAVGEFRIAHTGEDVADAIEIAKGSFRTNYRQSTYDITEEDNFLTNATFTNNCEDWILGEDSVEYFLVDGLPQYFNYELYASENSCAGLASYNDRDMLRLLGSSARQSNDLIRKPGTHKEYSGEDEVAEVVDKLYLNVRFYCHADGDFSFGFADSAGTFHDNDFYSTGTYEAGVDAYTISLSGTWDSTGDFYMKSTGDIYVDSVSLTDKPLDNFKLETSTRIEQDATKIALLGQRISGAENSITNLGIEIDASEERITAYVDKEVGGVEASVSQLQIDVDGIKAEVQKVKYDDKGNITNISKSGLVLDSEFASMFSTQVNSQGIAKTAEIKTYVDDEISKIKISADQIDISANEYISIINTGTTTISASRLDLSGLVTVSELNSTLGGYATDSELSAAKSELNKSISDLNSNLSGKIDEKASIESLNEKVSELNSIISGKADASALKNVAYLDDAAAAALSGSMIVKNGYLATDYIKVDTIWAVKGTVGGFTIEETLLTVEGTLTNANLLGTNNYVTNLQPDGLKVSINGGEKVMITGLSPCVAADLPFVAGMHIESSDTVSRRSDNLCCIYANLTDRDYGVYINGGSTHILSSTVTQIYGLALKTTATSGTLAVNNDFVRMTGNLTLPQPYNAPGKFYFVKGHSSYTLSVPKCIDTNNAYSSSPSDISWKDSRTRMFVSDGSVWYEFYASKS